MNIIVGSSRLLKINATVAACRRLGLDALVFEKNVHTGLDRQPVGLNATLDAAHARAFAVMQNDVIAIGIENGIVFLNNNIVFDIACVVVLKPGRLSIINTSVGIQFPIEYVREAQQRGFDKTTVGLVIAEKLGGYPADPHSTLTNGKVTREQILTDAIAIALSQL